LKVDTAKFLREHLPQQFWYYGEQWEKF